MRAKFKNKKKKKKHQKSPFIPYKEPISLDMLTNYQQFLDRIYLWYFIVHIPITILIDSCLVIPRESLLDVQRSIIDFHITTNKDFLLEERPLWLQVFGFFEMAWQLPFFFYAIRSIRHQDVRSYPFMIVYGLNAFLTSLVCFVYVIVEGPSHFLTIEEVSRLASLYVPYLILPFVLMVDYIRRSVLLSEQYIYSDKKTL